MNLLASAREWLNASSSSYFPSFLQILLDSKPIRAIFLTQFKINKIMILDLEGESYDTFESGGIRSTYWPKRSLYYQSAS